MPLLANLNPEQERAVTHQGSPLLIVAGPGTGKTTVITRRIAYLIEQGLAKPENILALTFTEKAATEMQERVDELLPYGFLDTTISTFHSFCQRLIERYGLEIGVPNHVRLLTETDAWLLVREHLEKFDLDYFRPLGNPTRFISALLTHFSRTKDENISPEEYLAYAEEETAKTDNAEFGTEEKRRLNELARAYHRYEELLLENAAVDFGGLLLYAMKLITARPEVCRQIATRYTHILIDEFQDTNWIQYAFVRALAQTPAPGARTLTVVGDAKQSIYKFRGASTSNILAFRKDFSNVKEIALTENYRSAQNILDLAHRVISNNTTEAATGGVVHELKSMNVPAGSIEFIFAETIDEEAQLVMEKIKAIMATAAEEGWVGGTEETAGIDNATEHKKPRWSDIAILLRANAHALPFIRAFEGAGIPHRFYAASGFYREPIIIDCLSYLRVIHNFHNNAALHRVMSLPIFKIPEEDIIKIVHHADRKTHSFYYVLEHAAAYVTKEALPQIMRVRELVAHGLNRARTEKVSRVLYQFLEASGILADLSEGARAGAAQAIRDIELMRLLFETLSGFETTARTPTLAQFLFMVDGMLDAGDEGALPSVIDADDNAVRLLTVHAAKGLEFSHVFIVNLVEQRFPSTDRKDPIELPVALIKETLPTGDAHLEEERRLFYVAATRAKHGLYLSAAKRYGGVRNRKISRFVHECGFSVPDEAVPTGAVIFAPPTRATIGTRAPITLPRKFSYSQLKAFATCPLQYKYAFLLKIPVRGKASFSFGGTMHGTLQKFYNRIRELNATAQASLFDAPRAAEADNGIIRVPPLTDLLALYEASWIDDWFDSAQEKKQYFEKGKKILRDFYERNAQAWTVPRDLERWFQIRVGEYILHGRIDRIDLNQDGSLEIIDYKTGRVKERLTPEDKEQLLIYQIAGEEDASLRALGPVANLTYYYLDENKKLSFIGDHEELAALKEKISTEIANMHTSDFAATPSPYVCGNCDFREICPFREL